MRQYSKARKRVKRKSDQLEEFISDRGLNPKKKSKLPPDVLYRIKSNQNNFL